MRHLKARSPLVPLSIAWGVTLLALLIFLWGAYDSYERFTKMTQQNLRVQELRGQVIHLDEVLTMSARLAVLTGDPAWEARYRESEPRLESAIQELLKQPLGIQTTGQTNDANAALVQMENESFALVKQGKLNAASSLLFGPEYAGQKQIYNAGMEQLGMQLGEAAAAAVRAEGRRIRTQMVIGGALIVLLVAGWLLVVRMARKSMSLRNQLEKVERDLDIAREIQRGLLPSEPPVTPGYEVHGWSKPADQTGGDYFDWMTLPSGSTMITLADVTGHGIGPALIVSVCRAYMRASAVGDGVALEAAIARVNDLLQVDLPPARFVTAAVGLLHPDKHELMLVSAGQAPLFFYHAATGEVENWDADGIPLGIASGESFGSPRPLRFEPGDTLVLATDGFFEWMNASGEQYGIQRLKSFVESHAHDTPQTFIDALHADVLAHADGHPQPDDLTVVIVKRHKSSLLSA